LNVHRSNRTEQLAEGLARVAAQPGPTPFRPEWIGIQGRGMERWLTLELSRRLGVWANPRFLLPGELIDAVLDIALGPDETAERYDEPGLQWILARLLGEELTGAVFAPVRRYLAGAADPQRRRLELARHLAACFDRYTVYRPEMLLGWEEGAEPADWQAELWRRIVAHQGPGHASRRASRFVRGECRPEVEWPARVHVFGASALPPLHLEVLRALGRRTRLHLHLLTPTREFYADTRSPRELARRGDLSDDQHWDVGHPLVASLGRLGRDFQQALEAGDPPASDEEAFRDPGRAAAPSMLAVLQSDVLALEARGEGAERPPQPLAPEDPSIRVHSCHGPLREIEVLHDRLLAAFAEEPDLAPHDVVVMAPDIDRYAPYVEAVFAARAGEGDDGPAIPYRIADRSLRRSLEAVEAFCRWLAAVTGRLRASEVMDLLALEPIRRRHGVEDGELDRLRAWVVEAGIRWGADAAHRAQLGQPAEGQNTWRVGLDRMWLGEALADDDPPFEGLLACAVAEGRDVELLGRLGACVEDLLEARDALRAPRPLAAWQGALNRWLDRVIAADATVEVQQLRDALGKLVEAAAAASFAEPVPLDVVRGELERAVARKPPGQDFLSGAVTFCEMVPMRSIPFEVVALVGLSDERFPRRVRRAGFDRVVTDPRPGDRSARDEDRQLFLEAVLSARRRLILTYVGQNAVDNGVLPPSVVVSDLLDVLERGFLPAPDGAPSVGEHVVRREPLQPFAPRAFLAEGSGDARSFDTLSCRAARSFAEGGGERWAFGPEPVGAVPEPPAPVDVSLDELDDFFRGPARAYCQRRLGLYLGDDLPRLEDREPVDLGGLDRWQVGQELLERVLAGDALEAAAARARAAGSLPSGAPGRALLEELQRELVPLLERAARVRGGGALPPLEVELVVGPLRLHGRIDQRWPDGRSLVQFARLGNRSELSLWLRHLVWGAAGEGGTSHLIGRPETGGHARCLRLRPVPSPLLLLEPLAELYLRGLARPLPLHPRSSRAYVERLFSERGRAQAIDRARVTWLGPRGRGLVEPESLEPYEHQLRGDPERYAESTFDGDEGEFAEIARLVYGPFFEHREVSA